MSDWNRSRWIVFALSLAAAALIVASFFLQWWRFWLYAPQYPKGLELAISLTGASGDVHEIDLLNHYIGMGHLADAAPFERKLAAWGVGGVGALMIVGALLGKRSHRLLAVLCALFPLAFVIDSFYWLHRFGHQLDPRAPLRIAPFTPEMFGNGTIGQFETFARPDAGFWVAVAGVVAALVSAWLHTDRRSRRATA